MPEALDHGERVRIAGDQVRDVTVPEVVEPQAEEVLGAARDVLAL